MKSGKHGILFLAVLILLIALAGTGMAELHIDNAPSDLTVYIPPADNPDGHLRFIAANEGAATISNYSAIRAELGDSIHWSVTQLTGESVTVEAYSMDELYADMDMAVCWLWEMSAPSEPGDVTMRLTATCGDCSDSADFVIHYVAVDPSVFDGCAILPEGPITARADEPFTITGSMPGVEDPSDWFLSRDGFSGNNSVIRQEWGDHSMTVRISVPGEYVLTMGITYLNITYSREIPLTITPDNEGTCGENVTWRLDESGLLTIAGTGSMKDYEGELSLQAPWAKYRSDICRVAVGEGVTRIGSWAFQGLENLTVAEIPATITSIGEYAFDSCALTGTVSLPEGLQTIENGAFFNNPDLTCVVLPGSITTIEGEAFASCGLTSVEAAQGVKTEAHVFYYDDWSTDVYIDYVVTVELPQGLSAVSDSAFAYCLSLPRTEPDFILPEGIQTVGEEAFAHTAPTFVWIPDSEDGSAVTVEAGAFASCPSLKMVRVPYDCEILGDHAFPAGTLIIGVGGEEKDYANANGYPFIRLCSIGGNG